MDGDFREGPAFVIGLAFLSALLGAGSYDLASHLRLGAGPPAAAKDLLNPANGSAGESASTGVSGSQGGSSSSLSASSSSGSQASASSPSSLPSPSGGRPDLPSPPSEALARTLHSNFPLSPDDIDLIRKVVRSTKKAIHGPAPEGRAVSVEASLDPGATFPVIHLVPGIATTVTVVDSTGAPWPIADLVVGNMKSFPVRRLSTPNGVVIEPKNDVGWTSLAIALKGRGTPAVLRLVDSERTSDTRVTVRIAARGPLARPALFSEESPHVSAELLSYLDGIPPRSAIPLYVRGAEDTEAWTDKNKMIVRTHKDVIAPAWLETVTGTGGMKVYVFPPVTAITMAGDDGIMKTVELEEAADGKR